MKAIRLIQAGQRRFNSSFLKGVTNAVAELPMREAARYMKKNMKWTAADFDHFSSSHANALSDYSLKSNDTIAVWMKECAEKHNTMLSATKLGARIADLDHRVTNIEDIREFLRASKCKILVFQPTTDDADYLLLLRKAIPEFAEYDDTQGQPFHSKHFPFLKIFIHTGYDTELGAVSYGTSFSPNPEECAVVAAKNSISDDTVAYFKASLVNGKLNIGLTLKHKDLLGDDNWLFARNLVEKKYFEVDDN